MRIVLSVDMEAIGQITDARQILACCAEYWHDGRRLLTDEVVAAATGLLDGGAHEVVVLDNHGSGNPWNIERERLPAGARAESWNVFDLPDRGIDGMLQIGYHPRVGLAGFVPHTYVPGLELTVDGAPISESHGRIWAAGTALLGIAGHAAHGASVGLGDVPFLVTQEGEHPLDGIPSRPDAAESAVAMRTFARDALRALGHAVRPAAPRRFVFGARLREPADAQVAQMVAAGWRPGDGGFEVTLDTWAQARAPLAAAMAAAMAPFAPAFGGLELTSTAAIARQDRARLEHLTARFMEAVGGPPGPPG